MPSFMPRSERITEMKWMQEDLRRGSDVDFVRSWCVGQLLDGAAGRDGLTRTSTWEILPMTLFWASRTGSEDTPSLFMSSRALARGLSPLHNVSGVLAGRDGYSLDGQDRL